MFKSHMMDKYRTHNATVWDGERLCTVLQANMELLILQGWAEAGAAIAAWIFQANPLVVHLQLAV